MHDISGSKWEGRGMDRTGMIREPVEFAFRLEADVKAFGAGAGDVVEFQLMYCPEGIDYWEPEGGLSMRAFFDGVRLSNKVRWSP